MGQLYHGYVSHNQRVYIVFWVLSMGLQLRPRRGGPNIFFSHERFLVFDFLSSHAGSVVEVGASSRG